jgi:hypothetical protein
MATETINTDAGQLALQAAMERVISGVRDPEEMRRARAEMDRMRAEIQARVGIVDLAVELVREARDP